MWLLLRIMWSQSLLSKACSAVEGNPSRGGNGLLVQICTFYARNISSFLEVPRGPYKIRVLSRTEGGPSTCKIRLCAKKRGVSVCPLCDKYPCALIENYTKVYPTTIEDGKRLKEIGLEAWVKEQEERAKRGFIYAHIKIPRKGIVWA
mgnify:CR=1 FL=1